MRISDWSSDVCSSDLRCRISEMAEFSLPRNSKIHKRKRFAAPADAKRVREFKVYRWSPDDDENPRLDTYEIDLHRCGPMVTDALIKTTNEISPTRTLRSSCRPGKSGSARWREREWHHA